MQLGYSNSDMTDPYILFETKKECRDYLQHKTQPSVRFYAKDYVDFETQNEIHNGVVNVDLNTLTIITNSILDFKNDYLLVSLRDKKIWRIKRVRVIDDGRMKRKSMRPRKRTVLTLIGSDSDEWR